MHKHFFSRCILLGMLLISVGCRDDAPDSSGPAANGGGSSGQSTTSKGGSPATYESCPPEVPEAGTACRVREGELCQWKRGGPCPPDPDQLRNCVRGKWIASAPAIACHPPEGAAVCPSVIPKAGEPCSLRDNELCVWKRGGACPPDPDQLRVCMGKKWVETAPLVACFDDAGVDAGDD